MTPADTNPFAPTLPPGRARALPWVTVVAGSAVTVMPLVATAPLLPPCGLLMLLSWRLLVRYSLPRWGAAPLGFADDLLSGQPLGSAVLLWSVCFILIDLIEQRLAFRDFWQDWLIAAALVAFALAAGRFVAVPLRAHVDAAMLVQGIATVLLFPVATRLVAWIDTKRVGI